MEEGLRAVADLDSIDSSKEDVREENVEEGEQKEEGDEEEEGEESQGGDEDGARLYLVGDVLHGDEALGCVEDILRHDGGDEESECADDGSDDDSVVTGCARRTGAG